MCGFLGEFMFKGQLSTLDEFEGLLALSKQRGPDATCITKQDTFQLGFNRLSILDLSPKGNQPKQSPSGRYHVVFNGEIYNYQALSHIYNLQQLNSTSDTEVVVHLLDVLGITKTLSLLNGMYAIAIIDTEDRSVSLSRDFAGIKPLFYGLNSKGLVFASQFDQVFKHPWFREQLELRQTVMKEYFGLGYMQAPNTIYEHIFQVNPGELLRISKEGTVSKEVLCTFGSSLHGAAEGVKTNTAKDFDRVFTEVIQRQLVSDVPLGTFLSGGIDSPLISAIAKQQNPNIEAFTYAAGAAVLDESAQAQSYAAHITIKQHIETLKDVEVLNCIESHFAGLPEPFGDYSSIPTYVITNLAKRQHTVMLSGDGGDELYFGYPRMLDVIQKRFWFQVPHWLRKPMVRLAIKLQLFTSWGPYFYKTLDGFILSKQLHISQTSLDQFFPSTSFSNELLGMYMVPKKQSKRSLLHWLRHNEFYGHMQRVLVKVDRMSMANSLEVRVPFLDKDSIDFAWDWVAEFKKSKFELKGLLKQAMQLYYPKNLIEKKKKGFSVPIDYWLKHQLKSDVESVVFETEFYGRDLVNVADVKQYVSDYYEGKHHESWGVWHIYAWQKWALTHLDF